MSAGAAPPSGAHGHCLRGAVATLIAHPDSIARATRQLHKILACSRCISVPSAASGGGGPGHPPPSSIAAHTPHGGHAPCPAAGGAAPCSAADRSAAEAPAAAGGAVWEQR
eukprot:gene12908-biopygen9948